jgi:hypothetical protein
VSQANNDDGVGNLRSGVGSIRRRISTMQSSLKRQSSTARQCKSPSTFTPDQDLCRAGPWT